jgi:hypothetical protein
MSTALLPEGAPPVHRTDVCVHVGHGAPLKRYVVKILHTLSKDAKLSPLLLRNYMDLLASSQPYTEKPKTKTTFTKEGVKATMAVTCTLGEMCAVPELEDPVRAVLPTLFALLLLRVGSTNGIEKSHADGRDINAYEKRTAPTRHPSCTHVCRASVCRVWLGVGMRSDAVAAFRSFLKLIKDEDVLAFLDKEDNAAALGKEEFHSTLRGLTKCASRLCLLLLLVCVWVGAWACVCAMASSAILRGVWLCLLCVGLC